jgi:hypothetical protein
MLQTDSLESAIRRELGRAGPCTPGELNERVPLVSSPVSQAAANRHDLSTTSTISFAIWPRFCFLFAG